MHLKILFFGATSAIAGKRTATIEMPTGVRSVDVFDKIVEDYPSLTSHRLLYSVNQEYATGDELLQEGDELAVFTAVSGG